MFDASRPPVKPVPGCAAVAGYIGGNTPHVWTPEEWRRFSALHQLPIWVRDPGQPARGQAQEAAAKARALGWAPFHGPKWRALVLDMESELDEPFVATFGRQLQREGFLCWPYMSLSPLTAGGDPPGFSVWLPTWNNAPAVPPFPNVIAAQYRPDVPWNGTAVDLSVVESPALESFGVGPRHG
jgi:hypothetical protein